MPAELKQLGFVPTTVNAGVKQAEAVVTYTNARLPATLKPTVEKVEQEIATRAAPLLSAAASQGGVVLEKLDAQVWSVHMEYATTPVCHPPSSPLWCPY